MAINVLVVVELPILINTTDHLSTDWQISDISDFSNIVFESLNDTNNLYTLSKEINITGNVHVRVRFNINNELTDWAPPTEIAGGEIMVIETPTISIIGEPNDIPTIPTIIGSSFNILEGNGSHTASDWIIKDPDGNVVFESLNDSINLETITIPQGYLINTIVYTVEMIYYSGTVSVGNSKTFDTYPWPANLWFMNTHDVSNHPPLAVEFKYVILENGDFFIVGGKIGSVYQNTVYTYNPATNIWSQKADFPFPVINCNMVSLPGNKIMTVSSHISDGGSNHYSSDSYIYDLATNTWSVLTTIPNNRHNLEGALIDPDNVIATHPDGSVYEVYKYTISTNTWVQMNDKPFVHFSRRFVKTPVGVFAVGTGYYDQYVNLGMHLYDIINDTWIEMTSAPEGLTNSGVYLPNNKILCQANGTTNNHLYNITTDTWELCTNGFSNIPKYAIGLDDKDRVIVIMYQANSLIETYYPDYSQG
jgi:hypothetical protein